MSLHQTIESHWQQPKWWLTLLLWPVSRLFQAAAALRRYLYRSGCLKTAKLAIPVVVVGNLHAGGTGKTPITAALVQQLQQRGIRVGIISRGYGRSLKHAHVLNPASTAAEAGDEPLMLYRQTAAPTAVAASRHAAGLALLAAYPAIQIIICDDGLQHYALHRDLEICVFPAASICQRSDVLPNGGLREPLSRLQTVDALIFSNADKHSQSSLNAFVQAVFRQPENTPSIFNSHIAAHAPYRFTNPTETLVSGNLKPHQTCAAAAAIANPQRFFDSLHALGFKLAQTQILSDHAVLDTAALPQADYVFVTEKDAAKLPADAPQNVWVLPIHAIITPDLADFVCRRFRLPQ